MYDFSDHLRRYGPAALAAGAGGVSLAEARSYAISLANEHYENFPVLGWLVSPELRPHMAAVYAFCRWADDLGDELDNPSQSLELLDWWKQLIQDLYAGKAIHPVMIALSETVELFEIPIHPWLDLISAFSQDQVQSRYETPDELLDYCRRSANPVGRIVLHLADCPTRERIEWSDSICTGLQLANFCQDVSVDYFEKGRVYLPKSTRDRYGVSESMLRNRTFEPAVVSWMAAEVHWAESHLLAGLPLSRSMPGRWKLLVSLFAQGGLAILRRIRAINYNVLTARPRLSRMDRLDAFVRATWGVVLPARRVAKSLK